MSPDASPPDLDVPRRIHVVAAGGAGMSGIATVLAQQGHTVTGSDQADGTALERLRELGVEVHVGHDAANVADAELVVISTAVADDNPEVVAARSRGIDVLRRVDLLPGLARRQPFVSVSGTHGKTTTTSMLATALVGAGEDPGYLIGAPVPVLGGAAAHGAGRWFVLEADESDGSFLAGPRAAALVTNIEADHLEFWGGWDELVAGFERFLAETDGPTVVCADDPVAAAVGRTVGAASYGVSADATHRITDLDLGSDGATFAFVTPSGAVEVSVAVPGLHNALNAAGALAVAERLGVDLTAAAGALARYSGVARRFERRGRRGGIDFVDDYAHLPTEVRAALSAGRSGGWERVVATFQPHRYSRTQALWNEFADAFVDADVLVLTEIYAAGEAPRPGVGGALLVDAVTSAHPGSDVRWAPSLDDAAALLADELRPGDLCMSIGAGDVTTLSDLVLDRLLPDARPAGPAGAAAPSPQDLTALDTALGFLGERLRHDEPLGPLSTYRGGGRAARFVEVADPDELAAVAAALSSLDAPVPTLVVGRGSNLLVSDAGFDGLALQLGAAFATAEPVDGDPTLLRAGGAASLPVVARRSVAGGLSGFEWAVGVPGSIGGAVRMNAGGHGSDMSQVIERVRVIDLATGEDVSMGPAALDLSYRHSSITASQVVVEADLRLASGDIADGERQLNEIVRWRRANQPGGHNAGSVFANPEGDSSGRLIDEAGCKGLRIGTAEVSTKHANFIQADDGGAADDVHALMAEVARRVHEHSGVRLRAETVLIGFPHGTTPTDPAS